MRRIEHAIPTLTILGRKFQAFRTVAKKPRSRPLSRLELMERTTSIQKRCVGARRSDGVARALWEMEGIGFLVSTFGEEDVTLQDPELVRENKPITHVGMGNGAVEKANFHPVETQRIIRSLADPVYLSFCYEPIGAMLGLYRPGRNFIGRFLLGLAVLDSPEPAGFVSAFPSDVQELISHGYGRALYFESMGIRQALTAARRLPFLDLPSAIRGMAFAFAMVNLVDVNTLLQVGGGFKDPAHRSAFRKGLVYALVFAGWMSPGFVESLQPRSPLQERLMDEARSQLGKNLERGHLAAFELLGPGNTLD